MGDDLMTPRGHKRRSNETLETSTTKKSKLKKKGIKRAGDSTIDIHDETALEEERRKLAALLETFTEEQMKRYESFRRSHLDKVKIKKFMADISHKKVNDQVAVAMGGAAKIFAGELIEFARKDMNDFQGPIHPLHIRNAFRKMKRMGKIPYLQNTKAANMFA